MTSFLDLLEIAAARGDGLHPTLLALCERTASPSQTGPVPRIDGMLQSGPHPKRFEHARHALLPQRETLPASDGDREE